MKGLHYEESTSYFWGPVTSTLDWCETNYDTVQFIAEFWNTLSNLALIGLGLFGFFNSYHQQLEVRFILAYFSLFFIGFGSFWFHATLRWDMQLLDELPMIYGSCVFVYCIIEDKRESKYGALFPLALSLLAIIITVAYVTFPDPLFHQVCYGALVVTIISKCISLYMKSEDKIFRSFIPLSILSYGFGFFLWNIDNLFCDHLKQLREWVYPFSPFFELHAWWHFFTAMGTYLFIFNTTYLRATLLRRKVIVSVFFGVFPVLSDVDKNS